MKMLEFRLKFQWIFFPKGSTYNIAALVRIMAWRRPGDKSLSDPMMVWFTAAYMRHSASMTYMHMENDKYEM